MRYALSNSFRRTYLRWYPRGLHTRTSPAQIINSPLLTLTYFAFYHCIMSKCAHTTIQITHSDYTSLNPQSRQSARLFLQSSELGLPHPLTRRVCSPSPLLQVACGRGGGVPILTRGQTLWHSRYICTLWVNPPLLLHVMLLLNWCINSQSQPIYSLTH